MLLPMFRERSESFSDQWTSIVLWGQLRELVAAGEVPNAGRKGAPRIRRADLPRKPGAKSESGYDVSADAAALVARLGVVR